MTNCNTQNFVADTTKAARKGFRYTDGKVCDERQGATYVAPSENPCRLPRLTFAEQFLLCAK